MNCNGTPPVTPRTSERAGFFESPQPSLLSLMQHDDGRPSLSAVGREPVTGNDELRGGIGANNRGDLRPDHFPEQVRRARIPGGAAQQHDQMAMVGRHEGTSLLQLLDQALDLVDDLENEMRQFRQGGH